MLSLSCGAIAMLASSNTPATIIARRRMIRCCSSRLRLLTGLYLLRRVRMKSPHFAFEPMTAYPELSPGYDSYDEVNPYEIYA